jgi:hypothetical protein
MSDALREILRRPRTEQPAALRALRQAHTAAGEDWNTAFGPASLYATWSGTALVAGLYAANRAALAPVLARPGARVIEVGGGDGRLWSGIDRASVGALTLVDPAPDAHARVRAALPAGWSMTSIVARLEDAALPPADAAVCSLTLHHVAGGDATERAAHGLTGPGKRELLERLRDAVVPGGLLLLNEADVYCDLALAPGDPVLRERLCDSYVRRCAVALLDERTAADPERAARLTAIVWRWCVDQLAVADHPIDQRDVYELDIPRWRALLAAAGWSLRDHGFTDPYALFCQYVAVRP